MRKQQKSPITETVINGIQREAIKAGVTLEDALRTCCERGWRGFKAEWLATKKNGRDIDAEMRAFVGDEKIIEGEFHVGK